MRIWDINPGYLNRQSLLGEHRELHGIVSIIVNKKKGYARHPETMRWADYGWALRQRHRLLAAEMSLRGYKDQTPVMMRKHPGLWPDSYLDEPYQQFQILGSKYRDKEPGRILLPRNAQQLWSQHKYSVMARDIPLYQQLGREVSAMKARQEFSELTRVLIESLKKAPTAGGIRNALQHMWGYVSDVSVLPKTDVEAWSSSRLLDEIQRLSLSHQEPYLMASTALSELRGWIN